MKLKPSKEQLLDMRVTEFGLGYKFDKYFLRFPGQKKFRKFVEPLEPAMTLREFFEKNKTARICHGQRFICAADGTGFTSTSVAFGRFIKFLKAHGFDGFDWGCLLPRDKQTNLFPFMVLKNKKQAVLSLDVSLTCKVYTKSAAFELLKKALSATTTTVTIGQLLQLTRSQVESVTGKFHDWKIDYGQVQIFRVFITRLQGKLTRLGFSAKDGPFMTLSFKREVVEGVKIRYPRGLCELTYLPIPGKANRYCPRERWFYRFGDPVRHFGEERWYGTAKWLEMNEKKGGVRKVA